MKLSVIILNYNVEHFLVQCVLSVSKAIQNLDAEIIVVDNNSSDGSCNAMKKHFPNITLIENKENSGFPKGNNIGVAIAKGEYICILNPDTVVAEDTFEKTVAFAEQQENCGIVGVKLIDGRGNFLPESKRGTPTPFVAFIKVAGLYKIFPNSISLGRYYARHLKENETGKVDILVGAFMVMKRDVYLEVGGFDEDCFMYSDDIDLSYMVLKTKRSNYYFSGTTVIHYKGESTVRDNTYMKRFRDAMNFFYKKHFKTSVIFDGFMGIGAYVFSFAKKNKKVAQIVISEYLLITDKIDLFIIIEKLLAKNIQQISVVNEIPLNSSQENTEVLFDAEYLTYKDIITTMDACGNKRLTFKNVFPSKGFMIGSNSSNDRGEVVAINR